MTALLLTLGLSPDVRAQVPGDELNLQLLPALLGRQLTLSTLSATSAPPAKLLTLTGTGFNPASDTSVRFSDATGYAVEVPAVVEGATSLRVAVPPYLDVSSGNFSSGTVNVQVIESQGYLSLESNVVSGLTIEALPTPTAPAGFVTLVVLEAIDALIPEIKSGLDALDGDAASELDAALDAYANGIESLRTEIDAIVADQNASVTIGTLDGTAVTLNAQTLGQLDRFMLAYLTSLLPNSPATCYGINKTDPAALIEAASTGTPIQNGGYFGCKRTPQDPANQTTFGEELAEFASRANLVSTGIAVACLVSGGPLVSAACSQAGLLLGIFVLETNAVLAQTMNAVSISTSGELSEANKKILRDSLKNVMLQPLDFLLTVFTDLAISSKAAGFVFRKLVLDLEDLVKKVREFTKSVIRKDADGDGLRDEVDNCPANANAGQADLDGDGLGNVCDPDDDNDGVEDTVDNCPRTANVDQADIDGDGEGDACDSDSDNDGIGDVSDNCPFDFNSDQADTDGDGAGDACDFDADNDGVEDFLDNCPFDFNPGQADADDDNLGNPCDLDDDNDGVPDSIDNCPRDSNTLQTDSDGDGIGDACDTSVPPPTEPPPEPPPSGDELSLSFSSASCSAIPFDPLFGFLKITVTGSASGPVGSHVLNGFLELPAGNCASWTSGGCTRSSSEPSTTTWERSIGGFSGNVEVFFTVEGPDFSAVDKSVVVSCP